MTALEVPTTFGSVPICSERDLLVKIIYRVVLRQDDIRERKEH
jgi:hypothetical protein